MVKYVSFDTNKAFRYAIKNQTTSEGMQALHEQYALWREREPSRYLRQPKPDELQRYFSPGKENAPLPAILRGAGGPRLAQLTWGFIPNWRSDRPKDDPLKAVDRAKKGLDIGRITWNAASETMFSEEKRTWHDSAHDRRCVILLDGFFIFHHQGDEQYPFYIRPADGDCMPVAGLWDVATINEREYLTCAILTQEANEPLHSINNGSEMPHRMPIVLKPEDFDQWLEPIAQGNDEKIDALYKLITPAERDLEYITVAKSAGGSSIPNTAQAHEQHIYKGLKLKID